MDFSQNTLADLLKSFGQGMIGAPSIAAGLGRGALNYSQQQDYQNTVNQILGMNGSYDPAKMATLAKGLNPDIGLPLLLSTLKPHDIETVTDGTGQVHKIDKVTGQDLGTIGTPKPITVTPGQTLYMPNSAAPAGNANAMPPSQPTAPLDPNKFFNDFVAPHEGSSLVTDSNGAPVKYGINQQYWPGENVKTMTPQRAGEIFQKGYFDKTAAASLPAPLAAAYSDTAFMAGSQAADNILKQSGGDVNAYLQGRQNYLDGLIQSNPQKYGRFAKAWQTRTQDLAQYVSNLPESSAQSSDSAPEIPGYTTIVPKPQWHQITDPAEAKKYGVNVGSSVNPATGEVRPISAYNMPVDVTDPSVKMYGAILAETGHLPTGAGRDAASMRAYRTAAHDYLAAQGLTEDQIAKRIPANALGYKAQGSAANQMAKTNVGTAVNEGTVNNSINIVRHLLPFAASTGSFTDINALTQALSRKTNDKNAVLLKNGIDSISSEYARVMTGTTNGTASSDAARKEAGERILMGYNNGTLNAVLDQMQQEMAGRSGSQSAVLKSVTNGSYSGVPVPFAGNQAPVAIPGRPNASAAANSTDALLAKYGIH